MAECGIEANNDLCRFFNPELNLGVNILAQPPLCH
jgi:hypothetical protein